MDGETRRLFAVVLRPHTVCSRGPRTVRSAFSETAGQMVKCEPGACSLGLGIRLGLVLEIGLVLGLAMVLGLAHFIFCHTSSPQNPASPHARILPIARPQQL